LLLLVLLPLMRRFCYFDAAAVDAVAVAAYLIFFPKRNADFSLSLSLLWS